MSVQKFSAILPKPIKIKKCFKTEKCSTANMQILFHYSIHLFINIVKILISEISCENFALIARVCLVPGFLEVCLAFAPVGCYLAELSGPRQYLLCRAEFMAWLLRCPKRRMLKGLSIFGLAVHKSRFVRCSSL